MNTTIPIHNQAFTLPAAVLSSQVLICAVVLGLDFIFFSGMQLDIIDQKYSFKLAPTKEYPFQTGNASVPIVSPQQEKQQDKKTTQNLSLLSSIPHHPLYYLFSNLTVWMKRQMLWQKLIDLLRGSNSYSKSWKAVLKYALYVLDELMFSSTTFLPPAKFSLNNDHIICPP